ncbi:MAG: hypothetical protein O0V67_07195 [Methanocorpusculum sp.]|nr:hypothetical protein [Methanocorpusculum sp.]
MAEFRPMVITNKGQALIAKMMSGSGKIEFTKISISETAYTDAQILAMTSIGGVKQTTLVSRVTKTGNAAVQVEGAVTNSALNTGYYMKTIALHAIDPNDGEIVYAACGASTPGWMPPFNGVSTSGAFLKLITTVSNADDVTIEVDPAAVATVGDIQDLQEQISDLQAFVGYTDNDIFGVEVDFKNKKFTRLAGAVSKTPGAAFDSIKAFGGRKRCNVANDGTVNAYYGEAGYSETGSNGQVMVEQPKFYYKVVPLELEKVEGGKGFHMRKVRYYVSDTNKAGFKLHPAFIQDGKEKNFIYLSAFEGCLFDTDKNVYIYGDEQVYTSGDVLSSIANAKPASGLTQNLTRDVCRKLAAARGTGWSQQTVQSATMTELLFLVEYASFNMQSNIGVGVTNKASGEGNESEITGATTNLGNKTGAVTNPNGYNVISYRGEENFFGNIWKWIDGINIYNYGVGSVHISDHSFADGTQNAPYQDAGITICGTSGYVSAFAYNEDFDWLFICSETNGDSAVPVGDYFYQNKSYSGYTVAALGGSWKDGSRAGGFYWHVYLAASSRDRDIGGRLLYVPQ